jgi:hypothetical protein
MYLHSNSPPHHQLGNPILDMLRTQVKAEFANIFPTGQEEVAIEQEMVELPPNVTTPEGMVEFSGCPAGYSMHPILGECIPNCGSGEKLIKTQQGFREIKDQSGKIHRLGYWECQAPPKPAEPIVLTETETEIVQPVESQPADDTSTTNGEIKEDAPLVPVVDVLPPVTVPAVAPPVTVPAVAPPVLTPAQPAKTSPSLLILGATAGVGLLLLLAKK